jgi:hypothetical protein
VPPLLSNGYRVRPGKRRGEYWNLGIVSTGAAIFGADEEPHPGKRFQGRGVAGLVSIPPGLGAEDATREAWEQLEAISRAVSETWPGASLGPSVASTAIAALRSELEADLGCDWTIAKTLRLSGVYGGGRIEYYPLGIGRDFRGETGDDVWSLDATGAYPTAMQRETIPAEHEGRASESAWQDPGCITTAFVEVPASLYPPLRVAFGRRVYYPHGPVFGTWTAPELRAAVACGATILEVHSVHRFRPRGEFQSFAEHVKQLRAWALPRSPVERFAKALAVQCAGALASRPSEAQIVTEIPAGTPLERVRLDRAGIYEVERFRPSDREVLSAAAFITGTVRAWLSLILYRLEQEGIRVVYTHTDGLGCLGDPTSAVRWATQYGVPPVDAWKIRRLARLEVWAANQRIETDESGREDIAAGGISRTLDAATIRAQLRSAVITREATAWQSARRMPGPDGWTAAPTLYDVEPAFGAELEALAVKSKRSRRPAEAAP